MTSRPLICCTGRSPIPTRNGASAPSAPSPSSRAIPTSRSRCGNPTTPSRRSPRAAASPSSTHPRDRALASESITKSGWNQRIALCLSEADSAMGGRTVLTELGADTAAPACGRSRFDPVRSRPRRAACGFLRAHRRSRRRRGTAPARRPGGIRARQSRDGIDPGGQSASRLHQPARPDRGLSTDPAGLGQESRGTAHACAAEAAESGRTHPATEPIPEGWVPCAHLYPPHPARDGLGEARPFDAARHDAFQSMIERFGTPEILAIKRRVRDAIAAGTAAIGDIRRPPRPRQYPDRVAAAKGRRTCFAGIAVMACRTSIRRASKAMTTRPLHHDG